MLQLVCGKLRSSISAKHVEEDRRSKIEADESLAT